MAVGIMAGEESVRAAGRGEKRAADAAEGELAGGVGCFGCRGAGEGAAELADALAEGGVRKVEQPADLLAGVAGQGKQGGEAQAGGKIWKLHLSGGGRLGATAFAPARFAALAAGGGAGVEGGAVAEDAGEPAAGFGCGQIGAAGFQRGKQRRLQKVVSLLRPAREASGLGVQIGKSARRWHDETLAQ